MLDDIATRQGNTAYVMPVSVRIYIWIENEIRLDKCWSPAVRVFARIWFKMFQKKIAADGAHKLIRYMDADAHRTELMAVFADIPGLIPVAEEDLPPGITAAYIRDIEQ